MKNRNMMLAVAAAAAFVGGVGVQVAPASAQVTVSNPAQPGGNQPGQSQRGGSSATARLRYAEGKGWSGYRSGYRRRPARTVAQDKRDARRVRNKARRA